MKKSQSLTLIFRVGIFKLLSTFTSLVVAAILARVLGADGYGQYTFAMVTITVMIMIAQLGLPRLVLRETAWSDQAQDWLRIKRLWRWSDLAVLAISAVIVTGLLSVGLVRSTENDSSRNLMVIGSVLVPLCALVALRASALRGLRKISAGVVAEALLRPAFHLALLAILLFGGVFTTPTLAMVTHVFAAILTFVIVSTVLSRTVPGDFEKLSAGHRPDPGWMTSALSFGITSAILQINNFNAIFIIGLYLSDADVGIYRVAQLCCFMGSIGLQIASMSFAPYFARYWKGNDLQRLSQITFYCSAISFVGAFIPLTFFVFNGAWFIEIVFGKEFEGAYLPLLILSTGTLLMCIVGPTALLLNMTGHERVTAAASFVAAVSNTTLNFIFVPLYGIVGSAVTMATIQVSLAFFFWWWAWRSLGVNMSITGLRLKVDRKDLW